MSVIEAPRVERMWDPFENWTRTTHGLYLPPPPAKRKHNRPIAIDLFCGCGGFGIGMIQAGFEVVAAADWDVFCVETYLLNLGTYPVNLQFVEESDAARAEKELKREYRATGLVDKRGEWTDQLVGSNGKLPMVSGGNRQNVIGDAPGVGTFFLGDIRKLTGERILGELGLEPGDVDCVTGGPPCQGYSTGGRRNVMDPRNSLVFEFVRLVLEIRPKTFIFENVPGLLSMTTPEGVPVVDAMCRVLQDGDFGSFDALKRGLLATSGAGAALQGKKRSPRDHHDGDDELGTASNKPFQAALL